MKAELLRDFFLGRVSATDLAADVAGAMVQTGHDTYQLHMVDLVDGFPVSATHLVRLCDAVLTGALPAPALADIAFGMIASDHLTWDTDEPDGARVSEALFDWSAPEINFPLRPDTIAKFRHRLLTGEDTFEPADGNGRPSHRVLTWKSDKA